jgi:hypothetical protein
MKIVKFGHIFEEDGALMIQGFGVEFGAEGLFMTQAEMSREVVLAIIETLQKEVARNEGTMIRTSFTIKGRTQ